MVNNGSGAGGTEIGAGATIAGIKNRRWYQTISLERCQSLTAKPARITISRTMNVDQNLAGGIFVQIHTPMPNTNHPTTEIRRYIQNSDLKLRNINLKARPALLHI